MGIRYKDKKISVKIGTVYACINYYIDTLDTHDQHKGASNFASFRDRNYRYKCRLSSVGHKYLVPKTFGGCKFHTRPRLFP